MNTLSELTRKGSLQEIKDFVEKNKDIPKRSYNAAIVQAVIHREVDIVEFLHEKGANINSKSSNGNSLADIVLNKLDLDRHVTYRLENIFEFLVKKGAETRNYNGEIFTEAVSHGLIKTVKYMLENGIDINERFVFGETALLISCIKNKTQLSKFLIENGADVNLANNNGLTPLHMASSNYNTEIVKLLLEKGADLHKKDEDGIQALGYTLNWSPLVKFLIEKGADVNNVDIYQRTPFFMAVNHYENYETLKLLLENGADPYIKSTMGELRVGNLCSMCKNLVLSYMNKSVPLDLDIPKEVNCFDEVEHMYISVKEFMKTTDQILIRIGENLKGYNRGQLISYYEKNKTLYSREAISPQDFEKIQNKDYLFFSLIGTGVETVLLAYSKDKFFV